MKPKEYVTSIQIRSLFSSFSRKVREGRLEPPWQKNEREEEIEEKRGEKSNVSKDDTLEDDHQYDIANEAACILNEICDWEICDFVAVRYGESWYPGEIVNIDDNKEIYVTCMEYVDASKIDNRFRWPSRKDE